MSIAVTTSAPRVNGNAAPIVGTPIVPAAPTPADKPMVAAAQPSASRFAELLRRNHAEAPKPVPPAPAAAPAPHGEGADSTEVHESIQSIESKAAPANAARARAAMPKGATGKAAGDNVEHKSEKIDAVAEDDSADGGRPAAATALPCDRVDARPGAAIAAEAQRPGARTSSAAIDDEDGAVAGDAAAIAGAATEPTLGHARGMASVDASERRAVAEPNRDAAIRAGADMSLHAALVQEGATLDAAGVPPAHDRAIDALNAALAIGAPARFAEAVPAPTAATALALATPIDAPDFAAALGVQVSVLMQDGVQQAELHLNPAETGPVSIHISLDGTAARVDFGADVAATRAAIERGLPELASALRDAGFTLAGGGVSQHAGSRSSGADDGSRSPRRLDGRGAVAAAPLVAHAERISRRIAAGGVDLYA